MLDVNFDYKGKKAAWHTADLPYLFDNITLSPIHHFGEMSQKINDDIYQNIIKLIKTGKCDLKKCEEGKMITRIYDNDEFIDKENFDVNLIEVVKTLKFKTQV